MAHSDKTPSPADPVEQFLKLWQDGDRAPDVFRFLADHPDAGLDERARICVIDQEHRWPSGSGLPVERYFERCPDLRSDERLGLQLIQAEYRCRIALGACVSPADFAERFPHLEQRLVESLAAETPRTGPSARMSPTVIEARGSTHPTGPEGGEDGDRSAAQSDLPVGCPSCIGRYEILRILGDGGFGRVFLALDGELQRQVAIKIPHAFRIREGRDVDTYLKEAQLVASLDHPAIVPVYDFGRTDDGLCYTVSKYVSGGSLAPKIRRVHYSFSAAAQLIATIADALHFAHLHSVVHRDVKPGNILLDPHGRPYLADFGIALKEEDFGRSGDTIGTPAYMSPEQLRGEGHLVDGRSDIFSLGVMMYELLSGRRPFQGADREAMVDFEPRPVRQIDDSIPAELERICLKALSPRVSDRYRTARDMAEDLRLFVDEPAGARRALPSLSASDTSRGISDPHPASGPLMIVPKGLRSFDEEDAGFFLELLPGPRDRQGLPESIHFWIRRILETEPEQTFRIGLIYGPSGCGKTSFVRAGVLPLLGNNVASAYVESTPQDTESRLLRQLRRSCPQVSGDMSLAETVVRLRRDESARSQRKVVIVLDQFEQWLHSHTDPERSELVSALRQCDGVNVQCVLAVRDDFWMAVTRFMESLESTLIPGNNVSAVDLFSARHARKVLTALGRSYGALARRDEDVSDEQKAFVRKSVEELAHAGQVVPVHLALFAEMVKEKPWELRTLREVGGAEGVGFTFLEETFNGRTANPNHRLHQAGAQAVLKALLSERGAGIKGRMRSYSELMQASGYQQTAQSFDALLRILDKELRLITPTDPMGLDPHTVSDATSLGREKHYHLTHDYLVPSLEMWLASKQKETRRGRAEILLAERARIWSARPDTRALPSLGEWLTILAFASRHARRATAGHRAMLRAASRHYLSRVAVAAVLAVAVGWWAVRASQRQQARTLVGALAAAATPEVDQLIQRIEPLRPWADPLLRTTLKGPSADPRAVLHARLALLPVDASQQAPLCERFQTETPDVLLVIGEHLQRQSLDPRLAERFRNDLVDAEAGAGERFRAGVGLICTNAGHSASQHDWESHASLMANQLLEHVAGEPNQIGEWTELLRPIREHLIAPLRDAFSDPDRRETERDIAAACLRDYVDRTDVLTDLLIDALPSQHRTLYPLVEQDAEDVVTQLRDEFETPAPEFADRAAAWEHARRRAHCVALLFLLGDHEPAWSCLDPAANPDLCSFAEKRLADLDADPGILLDKLQAGGPVRLRAALLRIVARVDADRLSPALRKQITDAMHELWQTDPDGGVHSAAEWALRRWSAFTPPAYAGHRPFEVSREQRWHVAANGQTMIEFAGPFDTQVGSTREEPGHGQDEYRQTVHINRSFAIAATETTMEQYLRFIAEKSSALGSTGSGPTYLYPYNVRAPDGTCPVNAVTWRDAVTYCQWLCELENIPEDQWCYPRGVPLEIGMQLPDNFLDRTGYRLPTEAEWEVACRAGSDCAYSFGDATALLPFYANFIENSNGVTSPVGTFKPNAAGLFDMHGNVREWCHDKHDSRMPIYDFGDPEPLTEGYRNVTRGGDYLSLVHETRSANRRGDLPLADILYSVGFRIARTLPQH